MKTNGTLAIISAPGGGGKNSIISELLKRIPNATRFVTTTTRSMRPAEREAQDYYFISRPEFEEKIVAGDFVEYNEMVGNLYGTDRIRLTEALRNHAIVFAALDVNGKRSLDTASFPHLSIFILPDSLDALGARIRRRGGMTEEQISARLTLAKQEIADAVTYDYHVVNHEGKMMDTVAEILEILQKQGIIDKKARM